MAFEFFSLIKSSLSYGVLPIPPSTRADLLHPDFTSRSQLSFVWSITEYPTRQSRMCFSSSCPKTFLFIKNSSQDHKDLAVPLHLSQSQIFLNTSLAVFAWDPKGPIPPGSPKSRRGCDSRDREHTLDSGVTLTCSPFIFEGFFFLCSVIYLFFIKPLQTLLWLSAWAQRHTFPYPW